MRRQVAAAVAALSVALVGLAACTKDSGPQATLKEFLQGWPAGKLDKVGFLDANGAPVPSTDVVAQIKTLSGDLASRPIVLTAAAKPSESGSDATAPVSVHWGVTESVVWEYQTTVRLKKTDGGWKVVWSPSTVVPQLQVGDVLGVRVLPSARAGVLDAGKEQIVKPRPVVVVGIEPRKVTNQASLISALNKAFAQVKVEVDLSTLPAQLASAKPDAFIEIVTLRREVYDQIRSQIRDLPGTVFSEQMRLLAPNRTFARALLGAVGDVTKEQMDAHPGKYAIGDQVGQSGLQAAYDDQLRGVPGVSVVITSQAAAAGDPPKEREIFRAEPTPGVPLQTTLDQRVQNAADAALANQTLRAAIVAVRVADGSIIAVANGPANNDLNLALTAQVPPGSTFKMVTALGLLDAGAVGLDTPVDCPPTYTVEGRTFKNSNNFELGTVPFRLNFAKSCNTAFASLAPKLPAGGLRDAARTVGIGGEWAVGTPAFTGSVGGGGSAVDPAAAAFGQGDTLVSPVALAVATACVARGTYVPPALVVAAGSTPPGATVSPGVPPATPVPLKETSVIPLRTMMREVVTGGTGSALADVPGGLVYAKTGTAEYDNDPAHTHAWTIGWRGDIAFAVFVEKGGASTATAVPIVESFLRAL